MRIYIAGPMTGIPNYNRPAFFEAAGRLITAGHEPINPATIPTTDGWGYRDYLRAAIRMMLNAEALAMLDGWVYSRGALLEWQIAYAVGMPCRAIAEWVDA